MEDNKAWRFLKDYHGKYQSHAWRIIFSYGAPMTQYCIALYDVIRNESIPGGCKLRYDDKRPYKMEEIYRLAALPEEDGKKAWRILCEQGLLSRTKDGTIIVSRENEMLGHETDSAIRMRKMRGKQQYPQQKPPKQESNEPVTTSSQCDNNVPSSLKNPCCKERKRLRVQEGKSNDLKNPSDEVLPTSSGTPSDDVGRNLFRKQCHDFTEAYPKKINALKTFNWFKLHHPSENEFGAIMMALARAKSNPDWLTNGGQYVPCPTNWLARHPWTKQDEQTFAKRQYEASLNKPPVQDDLPRKREMPTVEAKQIKEG